MKLISCSIENFGKLHGFAMAFGPEKTEILEENGWGKSTLSAFLRAMFYGLSGEKRHDLSNERARYRPWQGGVFGGEITFETAGRTYRAVRVFGDRAANDVFELYDAATGLRSDDYSADLGKELFKVDRESFSRTALIGQDDIATSTTDDMNTLIARLTGNTGDLERFEDADNALKQKLDHMNPKSVRGSLNRQQNELQALQTKIRMGEAVEGNLSREEDALSSLEDRLAAKKADLKAAEALEDQIAALQRTLAKKAEFARIGRTYTEKAEAYRKAMEVFPVRMPEKDELNGMTELSASLSLLARDYQDNKLSEEENTEFMRLSAAFPDGVPDDSAFERAFGASKRLAAVRAQIRRDCLTHEEKTVLSSLENEFEDPQQSCADMIALHGQIEGARERFEVRKAEASRKDRLYERSVAGMKRGLAFLFSAAGCLVLSLILFLLGRNGKAVSDEVVQIVSQKQGVPEWAFLIPLVLFVILVAAGLIIFFKYLPGGNKDVLLQLEAYSQSLQQEYTEIRQQEETLDAYFKRHGETLTGAAPAGAGEFVTGQTSRRAEDTGTEVLYALSRIQQRGTLYSQLRKKEAESHEEELTGEKNALTGELDSFLSTGSLTCEDGEYTEYLYVLRENAARYTALRGKRIRAEKAREDVLDGRAKLSVFLESLGLIESGAKSVKIREMQDILAALPEKRTNVLYARKAYEDAMMERSRFISANDMDAIEKASETEGLPTLEEARDAVRAQRAGIEALQNEIRTSARRAELLREQYEGWLDLKEQKERAESAYESDVAYYDTVKRAREFLTEARDRLTEAYAAPILEAFRRYYALLTEDAGEAFSMDARTHVTYKAEGLDREITTYSRGYQDLVGLCLRFALLSAMYPDEKPPVILDDPFTNLDTEKIGRAGAFIEAVAEEYQVIYFTCHESRKVLEA